MYSRNIVKSIYGYISYNVRYQKNKLTYNEPIPGPYDIIYVNPEDINEYIIPEFVRDISRYGSHIIEGDWDKVCEIKIEGSPDFENLPRGLHKIQNYDLYNTIDNWINKDIQLENTELYQKNEPRVTNQINKLKNIRNSIEKKGYRSQRFLSREESRTGIVPPEHDEVMVNIGRKGNIIFEDGRHRFLVAKAMKIDKIPVRVFVRHGEWQRRRENIAKNPNKMDSDWFCHPDITGIGGDNGIQ